MIVKICGLSTPETVNASISAGADMIGLVFFEKSPRNVSHETAAKLAELARGRTEIVALTVNPTDSLLKSIGDAAAPDWFQLHGKESPERVSDVRTLTGKPVMKALGISKADDLEAARPYFSVADRILFDAKPPKDATRPGGLGDVFDWSLLDAAPDGLDYMLSGGLTPDNVAEAIRRVRPKGLDLSSGVEDSPGEKSIPKIQAFFRAARKACPKR